MNQDINVFAKIAFHVAEGFGTTAGHVVPLAKSSWQLGCACRELSSEIASETYPAYTQSRIAQLRAEHEARKASINQK